MAPEEANNNIEKKNQKTIKNALKIIEICKVNREIRLDLTNKLIESIPDELICLNHIQYLYLERNNLQELPHLFCENLIQLKWLDIRHNNLKCLPRNIFLLKNLKNLLLEGNMMTKLPLELGLLRNLSGLNLSNNPLEFPPKVVIEQGVKAITKFLKEQLAIEQRFDRFEIHSSDNVDEGVRGTAEEKIHHAHYYNHQPVSGKSPECRQQPLFPVAARRHSLEENMLNSSPYSINALSLKERDRALYTRELPSSAPVRKIRQPKRRPAALPGPTQRDNQSGYLRAETIESTYERAAKDAEQRAFNEKADAIIQKRKDKVKLDEWRWRTKQLQAQRHRFKPSNHEVEIPYGNDFDRTENSIGKHAKDVKEALDKDELERLRELRDNKLEQRVQEHAKHVREWRRKEKLENLEDELETTKNNLEKALTLQKELEEKRALQYRLRAFTGGEFAPKPHNTSNME